MFNGNGLMRSRATRSRAVTKVTPSARDAVLARHLEQHRDARIGGMNAMPETWQAGVLLDGPIDGASRGILDAYAVAAGLCDGGIDEHHAAFAGAAVIVADRENAGGNRCREGLAIPGGRQPRGGARRRASAMVGDADQDGIEELAFTGRRQAAAMEQIDRVGKGAAHQRGDVVSPNPDTGAIRMRDGGSPLFHGSSALSPKPAGAARCYRSDTVTAWAGLAPRWYRAGPLVVTSPRAPRAIEV